LTLCSRCTARYRLRGNTQCLCRIYLICLGNGQGNFKIRQSLQAHHQSQQWRYDKRYWNRLSAASICWRYQVCILPLDTAAGSWKHKLFPKEVAAWRKTSWPSMVAVITSRCSGLELLGNFSIHYQLHPYRNDFLLKTRLKVKSMSIFSLFTLREGITHSTA
jgi:hypothetical protein